MSENKKKTLNQYEDALTQLSLNLDRTFLMILNLHEYFGKTVPLSEMDAMEIVRSYANISTLIEIAEDYVIRSRELIAETQGTELTCIIG